MNQKNKPPTLENSLEVENAPSVEQIESFARNCLFFAHRHSHLTKMAAGRYPIGPMSHFYVGDIGSGQPFGYIYNDIYSVHPSFERGIGLQKLNIIHDFVVQGWGSPRGGFRKEYRFLIDSNKDVTRSEVNCTIGMRGEEHIKIPDSLDSVNLDNLAVPSDLAYQFALHDDMKYITSEDFQLIASDVAERMEKIEKGELAFSELRRDKYQDYLQD